MRGKLALLRLTESNGRIHEAERGGHRRCAALSRSVRWTAGLERATETLRLEAICMRYPFAFEMVSRKFATAADTPANIEMRQKYLIAVPFQPGICCSYLAERCHIPSDITSESFFGIGGRRYLSSMNIAMNAKAEISSIGHIAARKSIAL